VLGRVAAAGGVESLLHVSVFCKDSYFSYLHNITYFNSRILTSAKTQRQLHERQHNSWIFHKKALPASSQIDFFKSSTNLISKS
jgi:hypothetical protein